MPEATLEAHDVFRFLRPDQVKAVSDAAVPVTLGAGDTVYTRGERAEDLYVVLSGQVALRLPSKGGVSVLIDQLTRGAMFGSCVCLDLDTYTVTAQCTADAQLLRIKAGVLKELMDEDLPMGYAVQTQVSKIYFKRYIDTMQKLQAIIMNIPLDVAEAS